MKIVDDEAKHLGLTINDCFLAQGRLSEFDSSLYKQSQVALSRL